MIIVYFLDLTIDRIVGENHIMYVFNLIPIDLLNDSIDLVLE